MCEPRRVFAGKLAAALTLALLAACRVDPALRPPPPQVDSGGQDRSSSETGPEALPPDSGADTNAPVPVAQAPGAIAAVFCGRKYECCTSTELRAGPYSDRDSCVGFTTFEVREWLLAVEREPTRASYDGAALRSELQALGAESCGSARSNPCYSRLLQAAIRPRVARGGRCYASFQCISGYCAGASESSEGTCTAREPNGGSCVEDAGCASSYCNVEGKCTSLPAEYRLCSE